MNKSIFPNKNLDPEFERIYRKECIKLIPTKGYDGNPEKISCEHRNRALANAIQIYYPSQLNQEK